MPTPTAAPIADLSAHQQRVLAFFRDRAHMGPIYPPAIALKRDLVRLVRHGLIRSCAAPDSDCYQATQAAAPPPATSSRGGELLAGRA